jgi:hypothetical protein
MKVMSNELFDHLKNVNDKSLIGLCIQRIIQREKELQEMLQELRTISKENPEIMRPIIGQETHALLVE